VVTQLPRFLDDIDLSGNLLSGSLPDVIGGNDVIYHLHSLQLQHNKFTGRVSAKACRQRLPASCLTTQTHSD
jgi:hypothetical protein